VDTAGSGRETLEKACQKASLRSTVLIQGESGTGKELVARAIHNSGDRASKPFVSRSQKKWAPREGCPMPKGDRLSQQKCSDRKGIFPLIKAGISASTYL
jgi:hypothetical protein